VIARAIIEGHLRLAIRLALAAGIGLQTIHWLVDEVAEAHHG